MVITARLTGIKINTRKLKRAVDTASIGPLARAGALVEATAKRLMRKGGGRGRSGPRGGMVRVPSAPGTPPHVQTGALRASISHAITQRPSGAPLAIAGPTVKYGAPHEFGSRTHPKRAFMEPALQRALPRITRLFRDMKLR